MKVICSVKSGRIVTYNYNNTQVFSSDNQKKSCSSICFMNERQLNLLKHEGFSGWKRRKTRLTAVTDVAFHSTHRYQSKLLVLLSKGDLCNLWGLLDCDDWRSSWWASRVGPQHDRGRSNTVMISMHFNSYASSAIFFIIPVLFSFVFQHETIYTTRVLAVFDFYYRT